MNRGTGDLTGTAEVCVVVTAVVADVDEGAVLL